jgi:hypothetical protein
MSAECFRRQFSPRFLYCCTECYSLRGNQPLRCQSQRNHDRTTQTLPNMGSTTGRAMPSEFTGTVKLTIVPPGHCGYAPRNKHAAWVFDTTGNLPVNP